jgi:hypothetical protein
MKLSYDALWQDTVAMMRAHLPLVIAIAGVFLFLPDLLLSHFFPQPERLGDGDAMMAAMNAYVAASWPWHLLNLLINLTGTLAILVLVLDPALPTVSAAIARGARLLPRYLLAYLLSGLIVAFAFLVLAVPALQLLSMRVFLLMLPALAAPAFYLYARFLPLASILVVEDQRNPVRLIRRSLELTRSVGPALLGLFVILLVAFLVVMLVVVAVLRALLVLAFGAQLGGFLLLIAYTAVLTGFTVVLILLGAAVYRKLTGTAAEVAIA